MSILTSDTCPVEVGKYYEFEEVYKNRTEKRIHLVNWIEDRGDKWYFGIIPQCHLGGSFGTNIIHKNRHGTPYGIKSMREVLPGKDFEPRF